MKKLIIILSLLIGYQSVQAAGGQLKEKDLYGIWKLKIKLDEDLFEKEMEEEDNLFAQVILNATENLVEGILDNIDIEIEFMENNRCKIYVSAFSAEEVEYTKWYINSRGELYIEDSDSFNLDTDGYFLLEDEKLVAYEDGRPLTDEDAAVYMVRIEQ